MAQTTQTTRRALIGGAGLAGVVLIAPALAAATQSSAVRGADQGTASPRLLRVMALHAQAEATAARYEAEVEAPARAAYAQEAEAARERFMRPVPHESVATTFININEDEMRLSTDRVGSVACAHRVVNDPTWADMGDDVWRQAHHELAAADDRRKAIEAAQQSRFDAAKSSARARYHLDAIDERSESLSQRQYELWRAALGMPSSSLADAVAKLDFIDRSGGAEGVEEYSLEVLSRDVRRLAKMEA